MLGGGVFCFLDDWFVCFYCCFDDFCVGFGFCFVGWFGFDDFCWF